MANEDNPASIFFDTNGIELPAPAGTPSPAVLSVQGVLGGTPISALVSAGTDRTATGSITAAQNVEINTQASGACGVQISGVWTGTVVFEATIDGVIWNPVLAVNSVTGSEVTSATANGNWIIACAGFQKVRVRGNVVTSGTATVFLDASTCPQVVTIGGPIPAGSATIGGVEVRDGANQLDVNASGQAAIQDPPNLDVALSTRASEATLLTRASAANQTNGTQLTRITDGVDTALVTAAGALLVDASATIQPVSGTVTANQGTAAAVASAWPTKITDGVDTANVTAAGALQVDGSAVTQPISAVALPLPTGAATEATLLTRVADATITARLNTLGQKLMAASAPVVIASDQSSIPITAAALPLPAGAATAANQTTLGNQTTKINDGTNTATVKAASVAAVATDTALVVAISPNNAVAVTTTPNIVGTQGNAWNAAAVLAGGVSASIDCQYTPFISVFGNVTGGATTLTVQFSQDNVNFYDAESTVANGDFSVSNTYAARYIRLKSSNARTITATIAGKD